MSPRLSIPTILSFVILNLGIHGRRSIMLLAAGAHSGTDKIVGVLVGSDVFVAHESKPPDWRTARAVWSRDCRPST
jgi:hypothetical protein